METTNLPGCHRLADNLLVGGLAEYTAPLPPATLDRLLAAGVDYVLNLVSREQFNAAGTDALSGPASGARGEIPARNRASVYLSYAFWPGSKHELPTARQVRRVLDEIDDFLSVGRTILLNGAGQPARAALAAGCWLARHGPKERGSVAARERARLDWLKSARAAAHGTRSAWNLGAAQRAFVCDWPSGKEAEPLLTPRELLEDDDVYPWATADWWLSVLRTVRVYPEGRQGRRVDAPVVEEGRRIRNVVSGIDLMLSDLHAGTWTGERTLCLLDGTVVVFVSPHERGGMPQAKRTPASAERDALIEAHRKLRSEWYAFQVGNKRYAVQLLPMRFLEGYTGAQVTALEAARAYEVSFRLEEYTLPDGSIVSGHGATGTGDAFQVLSAVANGITDWVKRTQPEYLYWFTQGTRRQRLFTRIVRLFAARGSGMERLATDPFTGRPCAPEFFWLARTAK